MKIWSQLKKFWDAFLRQGNNGEWCSVPRSVKCEPHGASFFMLFATSGQLIKSAVTLKDHQPQCMFVTITHKHKQKGKMLRNASGRAEDPCIFWWPVERLLCLTQCTRKIIFTDALCTTLAVAQCTGLPSVMQPFQVTGENKCTVVVALVAAVALYFLQKLYKKKGQKHRLSRYGELDVALFQMLWQQISSCHGCHVCSVAHVVHAQNAIWVSQISMVGNRQRKCRKCTGP